MVDNYYMNGLYLLLINVLEIDNKFVCKQMGDIMERIIGREIEVYIPEQYKDGVLLDIINRTNIGFKIMSSDKIFDIILKQNAKNTRILKGDLVVITKSLCNEKVDIELLGDNYE